MKKKSLLDFYAMKEKGETVAWITAYDAPTAIFAEAVGMDMLLVGDSLGMCVLGLQGTVPVTMEECLHHTRAVRNGAPNTYVIGDMPFLSYQRSAEDAVLNAGRFLKESGADAPQIRPEERNFSIPFAEEGRTGRKLSTLNCFPNLGFISQFPLIFKSSPAERGGKDPTTLMVSPSGRENLQTV